MRLSLTFLFLLLLSHLLFKCLYFYPPLPPLKTRETYVSGSLFQFTDSYIIINYSHNDGFPMPKKPNIEINFYISQFFILGIGLCTLLWLYYLHLCSHMKYVTFNTNLNLYSKKKNILISPQCIWTFLSFIMQGLLLCEGEFDQILLFIIRSNPNYGSIVDLALKFSKSISLVPSITVTPVILCLIVFQIGCH